MKSVQFGSIWIGSSLARVHLNCFGFTWARYYPGTAHLQGTLRLRLHETRSVWNRYEIGTNKPCGFTGPDRSALDGFSYPAPNGFTCESDPGRNRIVPWWYWDSVNATRYRRTHSRMYPIQTEPNRTCLV